MSTTSPAEYEIGGLLAERYRLAARIYAGPHCAVFRAVDEHLGREVAVKALATPRDEEARERFGREADAMARIRSHQNVAALLDRYDEGDCPFLVVELAAGVTLASLLREHGPLAAGRAIRIARQVLAGLVTIHAAGVVHRDVKPANLIVGPDDSLKIVDFGIAQVREADPLTQIGLAVGTPSYVSPEQAHGDDVDPRSDLYSLGVVLFESLAGRPPFAGASDQETLAFHISAEPPSLRSLAPGVPADLEQVVARALEKSAADRWQSAREMDLALVACEARADGLTRTMSAPATDRTISTVEPIPLLTTTRVFAARQVESWLDRLSGTAAVAWQWAAQSALVAGLAVAGWGIVTLLDVLLAQARLAPQTRVWLLGIVLGAFVGAGVSFGRGFVRKLEHGSWRDSLLAVLPSLLVLGWLAVAFRPDDVAPAVVRGREASFFAVAAGVDLAVSTCHLYARRVLAFLGALLWTLGWLLTLAAFTACAAVVAWAANLLVAALAHPVGVASDEKLPFEGALLGTAVVLAGLAADRLNRRGWVVASRGWLASALESVALLVLAVSASARQLVGLSDRPEWTLFFLAAAGAAGSLALLRAFLTRPMG